MKKSRLSILQTSFYSVGMEKRIESSQVTYRELQWITLALFGAALITLGSYIRVPMYPVPFTLQTLAILVIGLTQSPKQALGSVICYLLFASVGLPVLAGKINPLWFMGKCSGYLIGFPIGACLIAWMRKKFHPVLALLSGEAVIFLMGWIWLTNLFGPKIAFLQGVVIFLPSEGLKILAALALSSVRWRKR
jgi:biotin transport system substrate-specific component